MPPSVPYPQIEQIARILCIGRETLLNWKRRGIDIYDMREVFKHLFTSKRKPEQWKQVVHEVTLSHESGTGDEGDRNSHAYWKLEKDRQAAIEKQIKNSKMRGEMFDRKDGEAIQLLWAATLQTIINEKIGTWPQAAAGMDEAELEEFFSEEMHSMQTQLSDLESAAWEETFRNYAGLGNDQGPPADEDEGGGVETAKKAVRKRVVRGKRKARSRADS